MESPLEAAWPVVAPAEMGLECPRMEAARADGKDSEPVETVFEPAEMDFAAAGTEPGGLEMDFAVVGKELAVAEMDFAAADTEPGLVETVLPERDSPREVGWP